MDKDKYNENPISKLLIRNKNHFEIKAYLPDTYYVLYDDKPNKYTDNELHLKNIMEAYPEEWNQMS